MRPLPKLTPENEFFWTSGADGVLRFQYCELCNRYLHPPGVVCSRCGGVPKVRDVSGRATVVGFTVNYQPWLPDMEIPYVIGLVAIEEDPLVRLTTLIVDAEPDDVVIGLRVSARFEQHKDVWLPVFAPTGEPIAEAQEYPEPTPAPVRPMPTTEKFESKVAISGVGLSDVGRRLGRDPMSLAVDACRAAVADAGLTMGEIDGLSTYPGGGAKDGGHSEGGIYPVADALGIAPTWFCGTMETPGQSGAVVNAMLAVASGLCRHVLCYRTVWETTSIAWGNRQNTGVGGGARISGEMEWRLPYGAMSAGNWIALMASHYFHRYGATREQLGWIPVTERAGAAHNPVAIYQEPMTIDDYLDARMITTPFGLFDCDVPCDGSTALVVSAVDAAADGPHRPVLVEAVGTQMRERMSWDQGTLLHEPMVDGPAAHLWSRTDLKPADVDVALLYDGFSFNALSWLEGLGFCGKGEGAAFVDGGTRIARDGEIPLNPHGGQLSAGRLHGYGFLHEAVTQLRGHGGGRQVDNAEVAVVSTGGGHPGGAFLFVRG
ncbi:MAG: OB-fold domain-containing protein [bacterium]|nr:OB-fold domain-containing protein [bacterium]MCY3889212.1 OB-fold domain-containing protein [bacterium]MCY3961098.1 OB-fold domain-containing protein [bacterium]